MPDLLLLLVYSIKTFSVSTFSGQAQIAGLSIVGAVYMFHDRRYRSEAILAMWVIVSYLVIMSGYYMWWGGWSLGPRHIIPILPFFCVFLTYVPKRFTWLFVILSLFSIGQMIVAAASSILVPDTLMFEIETLGFFEYSNLYDFCLKRLLLGAFTENLGNQYLGLRSWSSLIPLLIVIASFTFFFFRNNNRTAYRFNSRSANH
jgi:hypothetical protein